MIYLLHSFSCTVLLLVQTTAPGQAVPLLSQYDLLTPYVVFLGLFRPLREGLVVVIFSSAFADFFFGGPPGLIFAVHLWLFAASRWIPRYVHVANPFFLMAICIAAVLIETLFVWMAAALGPDGSPVPDLTLARIATGALCAGFTGPMIIFIQNAVLEWEAKRRANGERLV